MAVIVNPMDTKMTLVLQTGTDQDGKAIITKKSYGKIKAEISNEDFFLIATAVVGLQKHILEDVYRDNLMAIEAE